MRNAQAHRDLDSLYSVPKAAREFVRYEMTWPDENRFPKTIKDFILLSDFDVEYLMQFYGVKSYQEVPVDPNSGQYERKAVESLLEIADNREQCMRELAVAIGVTINPGVAGGGYKMEIHG
ncbi:hypothetical protein ABW21_db0203189 [Orbilia brochopaga]|nr:hypothetical protein ABW21_db0203189 [Drechslerella brochopaga]